MMHRNPGKVIAVGRIRDEQMRISLRSSIGDVELPEILDKIFMEMDGSGGGHEHAVAVEIHRENYEKFIKLLRRYTRYA